MPFTLSDIEKSLYQSRLIDLHLVKKNITLAFLILRLSWYLSIWMLYILADIYIRGHIYDDKTKILDEVELVKQFCPRENWSYQS